MFHGENRFYFTDTKLCSNNLIVTAIGQVLMAYHMQVSEGQSLSAW